MRIQELEELVDQYRRDIQSLHEELIRKEEEGASTGMDVDGGVSKGNNKRLLDDDHKNDEDERLGVLSRKNRALQDGQFSVSTPQSTSSQPH